MKSLNIKKIATVAAGAAMLGAVFAVAAPVVDETNLNNFQFFSNGAPTVKVVVGSTAAPSDGVAAANIAAVLGNLAYRSTPVTVTGGTCSGGSGGNATGSTCTGTVSNEQVTLAVTVPASASGAFNIATYLSGSPAGTFDPVDSQALDRGNDQGAYYRAAAPDGTAFDFVGAAPALGLSSAESPNLLTSTTVTDSAGGKTYKEAEYVFVTARARKNSALSDTFATGLTGEYRATFDPPITHCTSTYTGAEADATCRTMNDLTSRHRVFVNFMGDRYVIEQMAVAGAAGANFGYANGGSVFLAKEAAAGVLHVGEKFSTSAYDVVLSDITGGLSGGGNVQLPRSAFNIYDKATGALKEQIAVDEGNTMTAPTTGVVIRVWTAVPGLYANEAWADTSVFTEELRLQDAQRVPGNNNWRARLTWQDNQNVAPATAAAETLYAIQVYDTTSLVDLNKGDSYYFMESPHKYAFTYAGLSTSATDSLSFQILTQRTVSLLSDAGAVLAGTPAPFDVLQITSNDSNLVITGGTALSGAGAGEAAVCAAPTNQIFVLLNLGGLVPGAWANGGNLDDVLNFGDVYVFDTGAGNYRLCDNIYIAGGVGAAAPAPLNINYLFPDAAAPNTAANWLLMSGAPVFTAVNTLNSADDINVYFNELAAPPGGAAANTFCDIASGDIDGTAGAVQAAYPSVVVNEVQLGATGGWESWGRCFTDTAAGTSYFYTDNQATSDRVQFSDNGATLDAVAANRGWRNAAGTEAILSGGSESNLSPFLTDRGTKITSASSTGMTAIYPKSISLAQFSMSKVTGGAANQVTYTLGEGATQDIGNGYSLNVQTISETVAPCGPGAGGCTLVSSGTPSPSSAVTVTPLNPSGGQALVWLDSQAAGVSQAILVGGPKVNSMTAQLMTNADFPEGTSLVKVLGSKVVVAGAHGADTTAAADALVSWMSTKLRA